MKKYSAIILFIVFNSFGQKNEWNKTVLKLQQELSSISTSNRKFDVKKDSLQMTLKFSYTDKTSYKTIKIPLKRIVSLVSSFNELVLFTRKEKIVDNAYNCTKVDNSQIMFTKPFDREKHTNLIAALRKIIAMNRTKKKI